MSENNEIDLGVIFSNFFSRIFSTFSQWLTTVRKNRSLIISLAVVGALLDLTNYSFKKPIYSGRMVLTSKVLSNQYCEYIIENINKTKEESVDQFAKKLEIPLELAENICSVEYQKFDDKLREKKDSLIFNMPFIIKIKAYSPTVFDSAGQSIINYLENNQFAFKRKKITTLYNEALVKKLDSEIEKLDSLRQVLVSDIVNSKKAYGTNIVGDQVDPINTYKELMNLYTKQLSAKSALMIPENIALIEGFMPKINPDEPILKLHILRGLLLGFFVGFLIGRYKDKQV